MNPRGLFITGTDTDVGKTVIASSITRILADNGFNVGIMKPFASGVADDGTWHDIESLRTAARSTDPIDLISPFRYAPPVTPSVAARAQGALKTEPEQVVMDAFTELCRRHETMIVEGVGGWLSPLTDTWHVAEMAVAMQLPVVLVARRGLGTINHTLLSVNAIERCGLRIAGIVINSNIPESGSLAEQTNADEIGRWTNVPILASVHFAEASGPSVDCALQRVDWRALTTVQ